MKNNLVLNELINRYPKLCQVESEIAKGAECLINVISDGRKLLVCGNGGSSSDSDHISR